MVFTKMKTLEFKLYLMKEQEQRIDLWLLINKWVYNRAVGLIDEFRQWNVWNKADKCFYPCSPASQYNPESRQQEYRQPEQWRLDEPLVKTNKGFIHPVRIAPGQPTLGVVYSKLKDEWKADISGFDLIKIFGHIHHKERVVTYGDQSILYTDCPSKFISGTCDTVINGYKAWLKGIRGFPTYKKSRDKVLTLIHNNSKDISVNGDYINIPKLGYVKAKGFSKRWKEGVVFCPLKVCKKASGYYLQVTGEVDESKELKPTGRTIGVDPGNQFVYSDDAGHQVSPPGYLKCQLTKLRELQRKACRQMRQNSHKVQHGKGFYLKPNPEWDRKNYRKTMKKVGKLHEKIARQRRAFNHYHSTKLVRMYDEIYLEDFNAKALGTQNKAKESGETVNKDGETVKTYARNGKKSKRGLIRNMRDNATGQLWSLIEAKGTGKRVVERVDCKYTSQTCPKCGNVEKKQLSERQHRCSNCGYKAPRDVAAAQVIKLRGSMGVDFKKD
jgi:putative transposase